MLRIRFSLRQSLTVFSSVHLHVCQSKHKRSSTKKESNQQLSKASKVNRIRVSSDDGMNNSATRWWTLDDTVRPQDVPAPGQRLIIILLFIFIFITIIIIIIIIIIISLSNKSFQFEVLISEKAVLHIRFSLLLCDSLLQCTQAFTSTSARVNTKVAQPRREVTNNSQKLPKSTESETPLAMGLTTRPCAGGHWMTLSHYRTSQHLDRDDFFFFFFFFLLLLSLSSSSSSSLLLLLFLLFLLLLLLLLPV